MRSCSTLILPATIILCALAVPSCSLRTRTAAASPVVNTPKPAAPSVEMASAAELPMSVPQTQVTLPSPQPIQAEALATVRVESPPTAPPPSQTVKPRNSTASRSEARQQPAPPAAGPQPPPPAQPPASRRRIRPVESAAERNRLLAEIANHQRQVQDILAKVKNRQSSEAEKTAVERIQAFLDQTEAALKDQDLQQAAALSNRALLLSQDLNAEK
jgi:hypothetical protein